MKSVGQPVSQKPLNDEPIAIIGMGCRLPGIKNVAEYWEVLRNGIETTGDIPKERWDVDAFYDPTPGTPGKIATRRGGFLEGLDLFDPYFFGISPREATYQDPQQRLMLETAWEAMEDAGVLPDELLAGHAGAILGVCQHEYASMQQADLRNSDLYVGSGGGRAAAGRLCTALGMDGPATTVDTACSSSLVAVHLACNALRYGDADLMFAGGVNVILTPALHVGLSQGGMLSPDGRCKSFDISADGYVRSEGATMVLLKPLKQAIADGNQVHGVIRATSMTNDGPHSPLMTPSAPGQELALREAYERAGVDPADVQYVEAHGTGTRVGDPIEMEALSAVLTPGRSPERPLHIGSCKTNIGHTEAAAGTAGLIKTVLSMKHKVIPPSLHCHTLNPNIPWDEIPVVVQRKRGPWPKNGSSSQLAGVNSFGISGTNAHVVVESAPKPHRRSRRAAARAKQETPRFLPLSARTEKSLRLIAEAYREYFEHPRSKKDSLDDICYTAALRRVHFDHRLGVVGGSRVELAEHLKAFVDGEQRHQLALGQASSENEEAPVFVFSGAGSHWAGMGTQLYKEEPAFAAALDRCDAAVKEHAGWSVIEETNRPASESRCGKIEFQPVLVALQIALFEMWKSWGVKPGAVVGHSVGEYSSAYASGALTLEEAMRSVCTRSGLIKRIAGKGRMLAVGIGLEQARACITGLEDRVSIGVVSGPQSIVLSGDPEPLEEIMARLEKEDIFCRWVKVDVASHSPQTEDVASELAEALRDLHPRENDIPIYSTVTGDVIEGTEFGGEYWMANMRDTVLFAPAIEKILGAGHRMFVEVSPHPVLAFAIDQTAQHTQHDVTVVPTLRRDEDGQAVPLQALAGLYAHGYKPPWETLFPEGGRVVPIPTYQWQRESFWVPMKKESQVLVKSKHAYLGYRWESAQHTGSYTWDFEIDLRDFPFLLDHSFQGTPLLPAAGYVDLALAGSIEVFGPGPRTFRNVELHKTLAFSDDTPRRVQLVLTPDQPGSVTFKIFCREQQADLPGAWVLYSKGLIELSAEEADDQTAPDLESVRENYPLIDREGFYGRAEEMGLGFGPSFQCVQEVWCRGLDDDAFSVLQMPESARGQAAYHAIHPGLLDSIFQSFIAYASPDAPGKAGLPVGIKELFIHRVPKPEEKLFTRFSFEIRKSGDTFGEVRVFDEQGKLIIHEIGHHSKRLGSEADSTKEQIAPWLYELEWQEQEWPEVEGPTATGTFLVFGDQGAVGDKLKESIESQGAQCIVVANDETSPTKPEDFDALLERLRSAPGPYQIAYLWGLDGADNEDLNLNVIASDQKRICGSALQLVQAITRAEWEAAPKLWIITRGAQPIDLQGQGIALSQAPLIGMSRTIGNEYPALRGVRIDLDPRGSEDETEQLLREMASVNPEREIAFRSDQRYALRMARIDAEQLESSLTREISLADDGNRSCELAMKGTGILDNLKWKSVPRRPPGPGQVEIRIIGTALNFLDVLRSLGMMPGAQPGALQFGMECSGRVVAIGEGVDGLQVGDEVVALDAKNEGLLRAYTTLDARVVQRKPKHVTALEAVTMPVVYQTAYYSLHHLARLHKGESILIHSAAGGVGLAALHLAQQIGAEVYATVGNEEKREYLRSRGVKHILDSHSLDFAEEILALTDGRGVDVVLNSLAGEAIPKSLSTLATGGRFVEIGKRDIYENSQLGLWPFQKNLSFFAVDLLRLSQERPEFVAELTEEIFQKMADGSFQPLPYHEFPAHDVVDAFRFMAQGKHMGKVLVTFEEDTIEAAVPLESSFKVEAEATYLITGGLGALGLLFATTLATLGAKHLALLGRRGETPESKPTLDALRKADVDVRAFKADISREDDLRNVLAKIDQSMPPIKGVIHSAVVLDDGVLQQFDWSRFETVFAPKIDGVWNLQTLLEGRDLDFFSLFSSAASVFGNPGQGNYSAANAFLDSLAHYRRGRNEPAVNINWGPWAEIGLAAAQANRGERLALEGLDSIPPKAGAEAFIWLMALDISGALLMPIDWPVWVEHHPEILLDPMMGDLARQYAGDMAVDQHSAFVEELRGAATAEDRKVLIEGFLMDQICKVLKIPEDRVDQRAGLNRLGLDSLMAVEFKNRVESTLPVTISVVKLLQGPSLIELSEWVEEQFAGGSQPGAEVPVESAEPVTDELTDRVDTMTDEEVDAALAEAVKTAGSKDG